MLRVINNKMNKSLEKQSSEKQFHCNLWIFGLYYSVCITKYSKTYSKNFFKCVLRYIFKESIKKDPEFCNQNEVS